MGDPNASLYPNLLYRDPDAAMDWLERTFGVPEGNLWAFDTYRPGGGAEAAA